MVEIIPYTEDDEDSSTWIPLSAPNASSSSTKGTKGSVSTNAASQTRMDPTVVEEVGDEEDEDTSQWQQLSYHPVSTTTSQTAKTCGSESTPWSWEKQIISHLTAPNHASATKEDDYLSEDDENVVWSRPNDRKDDDKLFFKRSDRDGRLSDSTPVPAAQGTQGSRTTNQIQSQQEQPRSSSQTSSRQTKQSQANSTSSQTSYRQAAKNKLQESLIYHPMRALPFCFLRNLYGELKHELSLGWATYLEANGGHFMFAPITFFILVAILGAALFGSGAFGIGSIVISSATRVGISICKFSMWSVWEMRNHLALLYVVTSLVLGIAIYALTAKDSHSKSSQDVARTETESPRWTPDLSTLLSWMIALISPCIYELVVILYSLFAFSLPIYNKHGIEYESANECGALLTATTTSPALAASITALLVFLLTCCAVSLLAGYLETGTHESIIVRIKRHLNACHTISIVTLGVSAASFLFLRCLYLYYGGSIFTVFSGIGTAGFHLFYMVSGAILLKWAAEQSIVELHITNINDDNTEEGNNLFQRMVQNALKHSVYEITTNAVWSDSSGLSGVLSEDDGTLRFAVLEWLIDRWVSSSSLETSQSTSTPTTSQHAEEDSSSFTSSPNNATPRTQPTNASAYANPTHSSTASDHDHTDNASNSNVYNSVPSYESLQKVLSKLDADDALLPAIQRYQAWIYSLPPSRNVAMLVAVWKMCPGTIALLLLTLWSTLLRMKELSWTFINSWLSEECGNTPIPFSQHMAYITVAMLSPILCLEYLRVRRWWARVASNISETESSDETEKVPDSLVIMVGLDFDDDLGSMDRSRQKELTLNYLILRSWDFLLDSIAMLESSIPVVRCATAASAVIKLSSDAVCLLDLAVEIKNRGLLGGIGVLIVDAFNHHLSEEIRRRRQENIDESASGDRGHPEEDNIGGKYTSSAISAVGNATKLAHNVSCLCGATATAPVHRESQDSKQKPGSAATADDHNPDEDKNNCEGTALEHSKDEIVQDNVDEPDEESINHDREINGKEPPCGEQSKSMPDSVATDAEAAPTSSKTEQAGVQTATASNDTDNHNGGGMPLWIGGGLALAGAVVGGLAVAANMKKEEGKDRKRSSQSS